METPNLELKEFPNSSHFVIRGNLYLLLINIFTVRQYSEE
jgi:hypothetical protein